MFTSTGGFYERSEFPYIGWKYVVTTNYDTIKVTMIPYFGSVINSIKDLLKEKLGRLSCFDSSKVVEPKNASYKYTENGYVIVDEIIGNKGDKDILYNYAIDAVSTGKTIIDLESINYYVKPEYTSKFLKVV
ncbi:hypothetical protein [Clostridium estertheticum]|uniref:hypothetical protein n=1 Tax=Clostridium estertheticum TaxID=238834 RepID=UPI001C7CE77F|nr:hypothetical protein [Clostridium estertheticum]MBX4268461.1 hypothetical protein [Clostridium estertheticum]WLC81479.1 peptidoglycan binding domain-containing protein [Clostridium estertheticum]